MKTDILDYDLPEELIAQKPVEPRDHSRLMVVVRSTGEIIHDRFYNLPKYIADSLFVFNDSKVFPARIEGRLETGGRAEMLLVRKIEDGCWKALVKPARKFTKNKKIYLDNGIVATVKEYSGKGERVLIFQNSSGKPASDDDLKKAGQIPLPPYIKVSLGDNNRYQTVYAREEGSIAAPTAGLHFTTELIEKLKNAGNDVVFITLHVGTFTFRPITSENIEEHSISEEVFEISEYEARKINEAIESQKRVVAVGTTTVRALESAFKDGKIMFGRQSSNLFIYPGYRFQVVDSLITNFHLPRTTLLALVYAFGGIELMKRAYKEAVKNRYRFFSFGDAMLII